MYHYYRQNSIVVIINFLDYGFYCYSSDAIRYIVYYFYVDLRRFIPNRMFREHSTRFPVFFCTF